MRLLLTLIFLIAPFASEAEFVNQRLRRVVPNQIRYKQAFDVDQWRAENAQRMEALRDLLAAQELLALKRIKEPSPTLEEITAQCDANPRCANARTTLDHRHGGDEGYNDEFKKELYATLLEVYETEDATIMTEFGRSFYHSQRQFNLLDSLRVARDLALNGDCEYNEILRLHRQGVTDVLDAIEVCQNEEIVGSHHTEDAYLQVYRQTQGDHFAAREVAICVSDTLCDLDGYLHARRAMDLSHDEALVFSEERQRANGEAAYQQMKALTGMDGFHFCVACDQPQESR
ncbi:MAG: hypothetical protein AAF202_09785 [Pseudomonadota bacterium]